MPFSGDRQWRQIVKLRMASIDGDKGPNGLTRLVSGSLFVFRAKLRTNAGNTKLRIVWRRIMVVLFGTAWLHISMAPFLSPHPFFRDLIRMLW